MNEEQIRADERQRCADEIQASIDDGTHINAVGAVLLLRASAS